MASPDLLKPRLQRQPKVRSSSFQSSLKYKPGAKLLVKLLLNPAKLKPTVNSRLLMTFKLPSRPAA